MGKLDDIAAVRGALATAERARDAARDELAAVEERRKRDHRDDQHRLRNMFSLIRVIARSAGDDAASVEEYRAVLDGRLSSYLGVQATVAQDWYRGSDLAFLIAGELLTFGLKEGEQVRLDGPPVTLSGRAAALLVLYVHELAMGAIGPDGLDTSDGGLRIAWTLGDVEAIGDDGTGQAVRIEWAATASASDETEAPRSSWCEWVEQAMARQLGAAIEAESAGPARTIRIVLPCTALWDDGATPMEVPVLAGYAVPDAGAAVDFAEGMDAH